MVNKPPPSSQRANRKMRLMYLMAVALGVITVSLFLTFASHFNLKSADAETWGQLGDFVGGLVNPWVGLFTVFLLLSTLRLQQQELRETRAEMAEQRAETAKQNAILAQQSFEQSFFSWFASYETAVSEVVVSHPNFDGPTDREFGRPALRSMLRPILSYRQYRLGATAEKAAKVGEPLARGLHSDFMADIQKQWSEIYAKHQDELGTVIRTLYGLMEWVDLNAPSLDDKAHYIRIVRSRLSDSEIRLLILRTACDGDAKMARIMGLYGFLSNFRSEDESVIRWVLSHSRWTSLFERW